MVDIHGAVRLDITTFVVWCKRRYASCKVSRGIIGEPGVIRGLRWRVISYTEVYAIHLIAQVRHDYFLMLHTANNYPLCTNQLTNNHCQIIAQFGEISVTLWVVKQKMLWRQWSIYLYLYVWLLRWRWRPATVRSARSARCMCRLRQ